MQYAEPPINPPEPHLTECPDCGGAGQTDRTVTRTVHTVCMPCEGLGEIEFQPEPGAGAYDTVKEAEGWA